jgi:hypothetical protein
LPHIPFLPLAHQKQWASGKLRSRENDCLVSVMRLLFLWPLIFVLFRPYYQEQSYRSSEANNHSIMKAYLCQNKIAGLDYKFTAKRLKKGAAYRADMIEIRYELTNKGKQDYALFNRGHSGYDNSPTVYVEPSGVNGVELSQKAFAEPKDKNCPLRYAPIIARASWLKANQTVKERFFIQLPLKLRTPFDDCSPQPEMPKEISEVKFCLGLAQANHKKIKIDKNGLLSDFTVFQQQEYFCSGPLKLE